MSLVLPEDYLLMGLDKIKQQEASRENSIAITKIEEALMWLEKRKEGIEGRGVLGTEEE